VKKELMDILACPMCKGDLKLTIVEEDQKEVLTGSLFCAKCNETYPIVDAIRTCCRRTSETRPISPHPRSRSRNCAAIPTPERWREPLHSL